MKTDSSRPFRRSVARIIREDELPPDLLNQVRSALQQHRDADELYQWTMQLSPYIRPRDVKRIGQLLQNALTILNGSELESNVAVTLSEETRETLHELYRNKSDISGPATYVLGFDLLARAYNRSQPSRAGA